MSQQLAVVVMIDVGAAITTGALEGNIYLIDNAKWAGSTNEGTGKLVTAIDGTRVLSQMDAQVLNWLAYGIEDPPPSLPQSFFLAEADKKAISAKAHHTPTWKTIRGSGVAESKDSESTYPPPIIVNITGEAVDKRVIFPAQYGSPSLFGPGLYWSATVNTNLTGLFSYTMHIQLSQPGGDLNGTNDAQAKSVVMTYDSQINVTNQPTTNGFLGMPTVIPS